MSNKPSCYLASGWFNPEQKRQMDEVYHVLNSMREAGTIKLFAPFYDGIVLDPKNDPEWKSKTQAVWDLDVKELSNSDLVIACTQDHDVGTLVECGMALAKEIPILCYNSNPELGLNLMLSQGAKGFCKSQVNLIQAIESFIENQEKPFEVDRKNWKWNLFGGLPI